jgi:hypothetical protein
MDAHTKQRIEKYMIYVNLGFTRIGKHKGFIINMVNQSQMTLETIFKIFLFH